MQRIPGVTLSRGDGGEGRNISVRGLGPTLHARAHQRHGRRRRKPARATSTAPATTAAASTSTSSRRKSSPQLTVRKTSSADVEEGSLGATVDLHGAASVRLRRRTGLHDHGPRCLQLGLRRRRSARFDACFEESSSTTHSACSSRPPIRNAIIREVGYSAVDILSANTNANDLTPAPAPASTLLPFCTPIGWTATGTQPSPIGNPRRDRRATAPPTIRAPATSTAYQHGLQPASRRSAEPSRAAAPSCRACRAT